MTEQHDEHEEHEDHDRGLGFDLATIVSRRRVFGFVAGAGAAVLLAACGSSSSTSNTTVSSSATLSSDATSTANAATTPTTGSTTASTTASTTGSTTGSTDTGATTPAASATTSLAAVPEETAGPFPADGSHGVDVLSKSGIVRSNIRSSFGSSTTTAAGVPTTLQLKVLDVATGKPIEGAAVYVWHCDAGGNYSMYSSGVVDENYLRGVQAADANGLVTFQSVYPACYSGRWPHIHYEVYASAADATSAGDPIATSQIAMPDDANKLVFATGDYTGSTANYARVSLATDMVFSDGTTGETPTLTGSVSAGYTVAIDVPVNR